MSLRGGLPCQLSKNLQQYIVVSYYKVISYDKLCQKFSASLNYLNYLSMKYKINILLTKFVYAVENIILARPFVPVNLKYILKSKKRGWDNLYSFSN